MDVEFADPTYNLINAYFVKENLAIQDKKNLKNQRESNM
tara:strand:- start:329 stop:445 length:117 start_codon:yes stop_codon:yes gene_type:complete